MGSCLSSSAPTSPEDKYARDKNGKRIDKDSKIDAKSAEQIEKERKASERSYAKASEKETPHPSRLRIQRDHFHCSHPTTQWHPWEPSMTYIDDGFGMSLST